MTLREFLTSEHEKKKRTKKTEETKCGRNFVPETKEFGWIDSDGSQAQADSSRKPSQARYWGPWVSGPCASKRERFYASRPCGNLRVWVADFADLPGFGMRTLRSLGKRLRVGGLFVVFRGTQTLCIGGSLGLAFKPIEAATDMLISNFHFLAEGVGYSMQQSATSILTICDLSNQNLAKRASKTTLIESPGLLDIICLYRDSPQNCQSFPKFASLFPRTGLLGDWKREPEMKNPPTHPKSPCLTLNDSHC